MESTGAPIRGPGLYGLGSYSEVISCSRIVDDIECAVDRDFLAYVLRDGADLLYFEDGAVAEFTMRGGQAGIEFTSLPSTPIFYAMGFVESDHVRIIDGLAIDSISTAVSLLAASHEYGELTAGFRRGGSALTIQVHSTDMSTYP